MQERVAFYEKWQTKIVVDAIQGLEDPNEIFHQGVCLAKCLRVGTCEQKEPDLPVQEIGAGCVTQFDRYHQARYENFKQIPFKEAQLIADKMTLASEVYTKYGYSKRHWLAQQVKRRHPS